MTITHTYKPDQLLPPTPTVSHTYNAEPERHVRLGGKGNTWDIW